MKDIVLAEIKYKANNRKISIVSLSDPEPKQDVISLNFNDEHSIDMTTEEFVELTKLMITAMSKYMLLFEKMLR